MGGGEKSVLFPLDEIFHNLRPPLLPAALAIPGHIHYDQLPRRPPLLRAVPADGEEIHGFGPAGLAARAEGVGRGERVEEGGFADVGAAEEGDFGEGGGVDEVEF